MPATPRVEPSPVAKAWPEIAGVTGRLADITEPRPVPVDVAKAPLLPTVIPAASTRLAVSPLTAMFPLLSRLTMELGTLVSVGGVVHCRASVPLPVTGEPVTVKSEFGAVSPTLATAPGKDWPGAKVTTPDLLILKPVSDGALVPEPNRRFSVALAFAVPLLTGSARSWNVCAT